MKWKQSEPNLLWAKFALYQIIIVNNVSDKNCNQNK